MTVLSMPSAPGFADTRFGLVSNTQSDLTSPITQSSQLLELPGARWRASYALPPMARDRAAAWCAFLVALRGRAGRFHGYDPDARTARGSARLKAPGVLTVLGGSPAPSGASLAVAGAEPAESGLLLGGDYIAYDVGEGRQLHMVTADAPAADGAGVVTVSIEPPIRISPADGEAVIVTDASCVMRLEEDEVSWDANRISRYGIAFSAVEIFAS